MQREVSNRALSKESMCLENSSVDILRSGRVLCISIGIGNHAATMGDAWTIACNWFYLAICQDTRYSATVGKNNSLENTDRAAFRQKEFGTMNPAEREKEGEKHQTAPVDPPSRTTDRHNQLRKAQG